MQPEHFYLAFAWSLILATVIPFLSLQHWTIRWFDFAKLQFCALQAVVLLSSLLLSQWSPAVRVTQPVLLACWLYNLAILLRYTPWWPVKRPQGSTHHSDSVSLLSANVLQFNTDYSRFLQLVSEVEPDVGGKTPPTPWAPRC